MLGCFGVQVFLLIAMLVMNLRENRKVTFHIHRCPVIYRLIHVQREQTSSDTGSNLNPHDIGLTLSDLTDVSINCKSHCSKFLTS
jgi:hypothetical protein